MASHLRRTLRNVVVVDEAHVGSMIEWLSDSLHQHIDDITRTVCAGLVAGAAGDRFGSLIAAVAMVSAIVALWASLKVAKLVRAHKASKARIVRNDDPMWLSYQQALAEVRK